MSSNDIMINIHNLSKRYEIYNNPQDRLRQLIYPPVKQLVGHAAKLIGIKNIEISDYYREFWALRNISFKVKQGETFGIIGRNGSGKSTLLQIIAGTLAPSCGHVSVSGRIAALLELGSGFNMEFTGKENIFLNGYLLGLSRKEIEKRYDKIIEFADIGDFINQPVKTYSSGMFLRLAFAVQAHVDASVVIIDEALAVGDVFFRQKCYARLEELRNSGAAVLLVSHSMTDIEQYCDRAILLDKGIECFIGEASEATKHYYQLNQNQYEQSMTSGFLATSANIQNKAQTEFPHPAAFFDLSNKAQIGNGLARCTAVALCNAQGEPCSYFNQGDKAVFYYEFELNAAIEVPICGVVIRNDHGVIVHGKNNCQYEDDVPKIEVEKSKIICKQEIILDLGLGDYTFEIGLATLSYSDWLNRFNIPYEEASARHTRICHLPDVAFFSVGFAVKNGVSILTHHGLSNLAGKIEISFSPIEG